MADRVMRAVTAVLAGTVRTRDIGGTASTSAFADEICRAWFAPDLTDGARHDRDAPGTTVRDGRQNAVPSVQPIVSMTDEITQAVFARDEVARYIDGSHGLSGDEARARVEGYLDELRTTQRYELYRALEYPLYPILRKLERHDEHASMPLRGAARGPAACLRLEPPQPHGLSGRAAGARRRRAQAADHRRRHQPVRRPARPDPSPRHRRPADPPQHQGPGVPHHAQGLRRRAAAHAGLLLLSRGRPQLQRRAEVAEDRPDHRLPAGSAAQPGHRPGGHRLRPRARGSRAGPSEGQEAAAARSAARWPRWSAMRWATAAAPIVTFGEPIAVDGYQPGVAHVGAGAGPPADGPHRAADEGAADGAGRRGHAAVESRRRADRPYHAP